MKITNDLTDKERLMLTMTSKSLDPLKYKFIYRHRINIKMIYDLPYFDNFENIDISSTTYKLPKFAKYIHFESNNKYIPSNVTHLTFGALFNVPLERCVLPSVTYLKFGARFNQPIDNYIPQSVTQLIFGYYFNQPIKNCIPQSVIHLTFGHHFNQSIKGNIPSSVTHLTFETDFNKEVYDNIPSSVTYIKFSKNLIKNF